MKPFLQERYYDGQTKRTDKKRALPKNSLISNLNLYLHEKQGLQL